MNFGNQGFLFAIIFCVSACGSVTWEDDADNWKRIYNQQKPEYVKIIHSRYTRLALLGNEFGYFFETSYNPRIVELFLSHGDLVQVKNPARMERYKLCPDLRPKWFVPESLDKYEVWTGSWKKKNKHKGYFKLFINKETNRLYWCDSQI
jgi:hypothetical protein